MGRTTDQLLAQAERFVSPEDRESLRPLLAGVAAVMARVEASRDGMRDSATVGASAGRWLTLLARGYGLRRATNETDAQLRERVRFPERQLTKAAILDRVNAILSAYTTKQAQMVQWWETTSYIGYDWYLDHGRISGGPHSFLLLIPLVGEMPGGAAFLGATYLDYDMYLGVHEHPVYELIATEVDRIKACGVRAYVAIDSSL